MDFILHSVPEPCQKQCIPKDLVKWPNEPFYLFFLTPLFCSSSHPQLLELLGHFTLVNMNPYIPGKVQFSVDTGNFNSCWSKNVTQQDLMFQDHSLHLKPAMVLGLQSLRAVWVRIKPHKLCAEKRRGSLPSALKGDYRETEFTKDQFQCCIIVTGWLTQ